MRKIEFLPPCNTARNVRSRIEAVQDEAKHLKTYEEHVIVKWMENRSKKVRTLTHFFFALLLLSPFVTGIEFLILKKIFGW